MQSQLQNDDAIGGNQLMSSNYRNTFISLADVTFTITTSDTDWMHVLDAGAHWVTKKVSVIDDDTNIVDIASPTSLTIEGGQITYSIVLKSSPPRGETVTIKIQPTSSFVTVKSPSDGTVEFDSTNWYIDIDVILQTSHDTISHNTENQVDTLLGPTMSYIQVMHTITSPKWWAYTIPNNGLSTFAFVDTSIPRLIWRDGETLMGNGETVSVHVSLSTEAYAVVEITVTCDVTTNIEVVTEQPVRIYPYNWKMGAAVAFHHKYQQSITGGMQYKCQVTSLSEDTSYSFSGSNIEDATASYIRGGELRFVVHTEGCILTPDTCSPMPCPDGHKCAADYKLTCPSGTYSPSGVMDCLACPPGYFCQGGTNAPQECQQGYYSFHGLTTCLQCPPGYYCPNTNADPLPCQHGSYSTGEATSCTDCPSGHFCPGPPYWNSFECPSGTISHSKQVECLDCPSGYSCPTKLLNDIAPCTTGTFSLTKWDYCITCPKGYQCTSIHGDDFRSCLAGEYTVAGEGKCKKCPAGKRCPTPLQDPIDCDAPSQFSLEGSTVCSLCPAGYSCAGATPQLCPEGQYSYRGVGTCALCTAGYWCPPGGDRPSSMEFEVPIGGYLDVAAFVYTKCPPGQYGIKDGATSLAEGCATCPEGFYCPYSGLWDYVEFRCPIFHYCPPGSTEPTPCPAGTTNTYIRAANILECTPCMVGEYCDGTGSPPVLCAVGSVCEMATTVTGCPPGTYSTSMGLYAKQQCTICPLGHWCDPDTSSGAPQKCAAGTYQPHFGASDADACITCPAGYLCNEGSHDVSKGCPIGHYCPRGSSVAKPCPVGTYSEEEYLVYDSQCTACPQNWACPQGSSFTNNIPTYSIGEGYELNTVCSAGQYLEPREGVFVCTVCPKGKYCEIEATHEDIKDCTNPDHCPKGMTTDAVFECEDGYSSYWADEAPVCLPCPYGWFCNKAELVQRCPTGTYTPHLGTAYSSVTKGGISACLQIPLGYTNVVGYTSTRCSTGSYSNSDAADYNGECTQCPAGVYCIRDGMHMQQIMEDFLCPPGYLCPAGIKKHPRFTDDDCPLNEYCELGSTGGKPCPVGTYRATVNGRDVTDCLTTEPGVLSTNPSVTCPAGHYCPEGSSSVHFMKCPPRTYSEEGGRWLSDCKLCPAGKYCPSAATVTPTECPAGHYCEEGVQLPTPCPPSTYSAVTNQASIDSCTLCTAGYYCDAFGASSVTGECDSGFYCLGGASSPRPTNSGNGDVCPTGYYCPSKSTHPLPCAAGYYNDCKGATECKQCVAGYGCNQFGMYDYECVPPHCDSSYNPFVNAEAGFKAPLNVIKSIPCELGTYTPYTGASLCIKCPQGYYCDALALTSPKLCIAGHYCPAGSSTYTPCPPGTFSDVEGLTSEEECTPCSPGRYCSNYGLTTDDGECEGGYYCLTGSSNSAPEEKGADDRWGPCPVGHYCPAGTSTPTPCAAGTYLPYTKATSAASCLPCPFHKYCQTEGLGIPTGDCYDGYMCQGGASHPSAVENICPRGSFCDNSNVAPNKCRPGTYQDEYGSTECKRCPAGHYCELGSVLGSSVDRRCPRGSICPAGTPSKNSFRCPPGTYNPTIGSSSFHDCIVCTPGAYCLSYGLTNPTGWCDGGFYCTSGSVVPQPDTYKCTYEYSILGSPTSSCDDNTLVYRTKEEAISSCEAVTCDGVAEQSDGWVIRCGDMVSSSSVWYPRICGGGGICPSGSYCPPTSSSPIECPPGKYCDRPGLSEVTGDCIKGYYCPSGETLHSFTERRCTPGHYCPEGVSQGIPCPVGFYLNGSGASDITECQQCPLGMYCSTPGLTVPALTCPEGSSCEMLIPLYGTPSSEEEDNNEMQPEPDPETTCAAGYYCMENYKPAMCPTGHYCPPHTTYATQYPCPIGTYNRWRGGKSISYCVECLQGYYCDEPGMSYPTACEEGYHCPAGSLSQTPCTPGYYCPALSVKPVDCPQNMYCSENLLGKPSGLCDAGHVCISSNPLPSPIEDEEGATHIGGLCPEGFFCLMGSGSVTSINGFLNQQESFTPLLSSPSDVIVNTETGDIIVVDSDNNRVVKLNNDDGVLTELVSPTVNNGGISWISTGKPNRIVFDCTASTLYISYTDNNAIVSHGLETKETLVFISPDAAAFSKPVGMAFNCDDSTQHLYAAFSGTCNVGKIAVSDRTIASFVGASTCGDTEEGDVLSEVKLNEPIDVEFDSFGVLYIADSGNKKVKYVTSYGELKTLEDAGGSPFLFNGVNSIEAAVTQQGRDVLYFIEKESHTVSVIDVLSLKKETIAGRGTAGYVGDGGITQSVNAAFQDPSTIYFIKDETNGWMASLLLSDTGNNVIREIHLPYNQPKTPCPTGTYLPNKGGISLRDCLPCPSGYYCSEENAIMPTGRCDTPGWYCSEGSVMDTRCPEGTYCVATEMTKEKIHGMSDLLITELGSSHYGSIPDVDIEATEYLQYADVDLPFFTAQQFVVIISTINELPLMQAANQLSIHSLHSHTTGWILLYSLQLLSGRQQYVIDVPDIIVKRIRITFEGGDGVYIESFEIWGTNDGVTRSAVDCPLGSYQPHKGMGSCYECDAGYYCNGFGLASKTQCERGYYCPPGTVHYAQHPCPVGSFSNEVGLTRAADCTACSAGKYCASTGLTEPTGSCAAGFYCGGGARISTPFDVSIDVTNIKRDAGVCPAGHYCPEESIEPTQCPDGKHSHPMSKAVEDCFICLSGHYCAGNGEMKLCSAGYVCLHGSTVGTPTDASMGYICPVGHWCGEGSPTKQKCPPGTYADKQGMSSCLPCVGGTYCPGWGATSPTSCPAGYQCSEDVPLPLPCPPGNASFASSNQCYECPVAHYCNSAYALGSVTGLCSAGYYCESGSDSPTPRDVYDGDTVLNGLCPKGYFCVYGAYEPTACPPGYYQDVTGGVDCKLCVGGSYCEEAASIAPTGYCTAGYYCSQGASTPTPIDGVTGGICPRGSYCPEGSKTPLACSVGTYSNEEGVKECLPCMDGYYCKGGDTPPVLCDDRWQCNGGSTFICPAGTLLPTNYHSLTPSNGDCISCGIGQYCRYGRTYPCDAGYFCALNNFNPSSNSDDAFTPAVTSFDIITPIVLLTIENWKTDYATSSGSIECPKGTYCERGTLYPVDCPPLTYRDVFGGRSIDDCIPCPPGKTCPREGMEAPEECPRGYYCRGLLLDVLPCPVGYYNDELGASALNDCKSCDAGYECGEAQETMGDLCKAGYYCPGGGYPPVPCTEGTYLPTTGGTSREDCITCTGGATCAVGSASAVPCSAGYYCPAGGSQAIVCPPLHYCPSSSEEPTKCTEFVKSWRMGLTEASQCTADEAFRMTCIPGTFKSMDAGGTSSCTPCPEGTYSNLFDAATCLPCPAGYVCTGGTSTSVPTVEATHNGKRCPVGMYCPEGSAAPAKCPPGTYRDIEGGASLTDCYTCPGHSVNPNEGQTTCQLCGTTSTPDASHTSCNCIGSNRQLQASDMYCVCHSNYYAPTSLIEDGIEDCVPLLRQLCSAPSVQDIRGDCVDPIEYCVSMCGHSNGVYIEGSGMCACSSNATRQSAGRSLQSVGEEPPTVQPIITVGDGVLNIKYSTNSAVVSIPKLQAGSAPIMVGGPSCTITEGDGCVVAFTQVSSGTLGGLQHPTDALITELLKQSQDPFSFSPSNSEKQVVDVNPLFCLPVGTTIMWILDGSDYPVFLVDAVVGVSSPFDYGAFRELDELIASDVWPLLVAQTFVDKGTYAFSLNGNQQASMLVNIVDSMASCDAPTQKLQPKTISVLTTYARASSTIQHFKTPTAHYRLIAVALIILATIDLLIVGAIRQFMWNFSSPIIDLRNTDGWRKWMKWLPKITSRNTAEENINTLAHAVVLKIKKAHEVVMSAKSKPFVESYNEGDDVGLLSLLNKDKIEEMKRTNVHLEIIKDTLDMKLDIIQESVAQWAHGVNVAKQEAGDAPTRDLSEMAGAASDIILDSCVMPKLKDKLHRLSVQLRVAVFDKASLNLIKQNYEDMEPHFREEMNRHFSKSALQKKLEFINDTLDGMIHVKLCSIPRQIASIDGEALEALSVTLSNNAFDVHEAFKNIVMLAVEAFVGYKYGCISNEKLFMQTKHKESEVKEVEDRYISLVHACEQNKMEFEAAVEAITKATAALRKLLNPVKVEVQAYRSKSIKSIRSFSKECLDKCRSTLKYHQSNKSTLFDELHRMYLDETIERVMISIELELLNKRRRRETRDKLMTDMFGGEQEETYSQIIESLRRLESELYAERTQKAEKLQYAVKCCRQTQQNLRMGIAKLLLEFGETELMHRLLFIESTAECCVQVLHENAIYGAERILKNAVESLSDMTKFVATLKGGAKDKAASITKKLETHLKKLQQTFDASLDVVEAANRKRTNDLKELLEKKALSFNADCVVRVEFAKNEATQFLNSLEKLALKELKVRHENEISRLDEENRLIEGQVDDMILQNLPEDASLLEVEKIAEETLRDIMGEERSKLKLCFNRFRWRYHEYKNKRVHGNHQNQLRKSKLELQMEKNFILEILNIFDESAMDETSFQENTKRVLYGAASFISLSTKHVKNSDVISGNWETAVDITQWKQKLQSQFIVKRSEKNVANRNAVSSCVEGRIQQLMKRTNRSLSDFERSGHEISTVVEKMDHFDVSFSRRFSSLLGIYGYLKGMELKVHEQVTGSQISKSDATLAMEKVTDVEKFQLSDAPKINEESSMNQTRKGSNRSAAESLSAPNNVDINHPFSRCLFELEEPTLRAVIHLEKQYEKKCFSVFADFFKTNERATEDVIMARHERELSRLIAKRAYDMSKNLSSLVTKCLPFKIITNVEIEQPSKGGEEEGVLLRANAMKRLRRKYKKLTMTFHEETLQALELQMRTHKDEFEKITDSIYFLSSRANARELAAIRSAVEPEVSKGGTTDTAAALDGQHPFTIISKDLSYKRIDAFLKERIGEAEWFEKKRISRLLNENESNSSEAKVFAEERRSAIDSITNEHKLQVMALEKRLKSRFDYKIKEEEKFRSERLEALRAMLESMPKKDGHKQMLGLDSDGSDESDDGDGYEVNGESDLAVVSINKDVIEDVQFDSNVGVEKCLKIWREMHQRKNSINSNVIHLFQ